MILNKYTKNSIFSLPLYFKQLTAKELKDNEFVNMYVEDLNKPITDCVHLVFKAIKPELLNKLKQTKGYHSISFYTINNVDYCVLAFTLQGNHDLLSFENIQKGKYHLLSLADKVRIIRFWYNPAINDKIFEYLFDDTSPKDKPINEVIDVADKIKAVSY